MIQFNFQVDFDSEENDVERTSRRKRFRAKRDGLDYNELTEYFDDFHNETEESDFSTDATEDEYKAPKKVMKTTVQKRQLKRVRRGQSRRFVRSNVRTRMRGLSRAEILSQHEQFVSGLHSDDLEHGGQPPVKTIQEKSVPVLSKGKITNKNDIK